MLGITTKRRRTGHGVKAQRQSNRPPGGAAGRAGRRARLARAAGPAVEALEGRTLRSAGDLDPTFGGGTGKVLTAFPSAAFARTMAAVLQGNKLVVGGQSAGAPNANQFLIARYNADGSPDQSWGGGDGRVSTSFAGFDGVELEGFVPLPGGKLRAIGNAGFNHHAFAFAQYNPDGSLDPSFGAGGQQVVGLGDFANIAAVPLGPQGQFATLGVFGDDDNEFAEFMLNNDALQVGRPPGGDVVLGQFDNTFAGAFGPDGSFVVAGFSSAFGIFLARFNADFALDPLWGHGGADGDGYLSGLTIGPRDLAVLPDGKVLVAGEQGVIRLNPNGTTDPFFGAGGLAAQNFQVRAMAVQADGRILLAGDTIAGGGDFVLRRLNADGSVDKSFDGGGDGTVTTGFGADEDVAKVLVGPDGKVTVVGQSFNNFFGKFAVARYKGDPPPADTVAVAGTAGNDTIKVTQTGSTLRIDKNGVVSTLSTAGKTKLVLDGLDGNDVLSVAPNVTLQAFLYGGRGDDVLRSGGGKTDLFGGPGVDAADYADRAAGLKITVDDLRNDGVGTSPSSDNVHTDVEIVLGGGGNDTLVAGPQVSMLIGSGGDDRLIGGGDRDVLVGGKGKDDLAGNDGDDLLIDAATAFDANPAALRAVFREWGNFAHAYPQRIAALTSGVGPGGTVRLNASTVVNDAAADTLRGNGNRDWFIRHAGDLVTDKAADETVTAV